jgi:hypothetical protein
MDAGVQLRIIRGKIVQNWALDRLAAYLDP